MKGRKMKNIIVSKKNKIPKIIISEKKKHFQDIFGKHWKSVYESSPLLSRSEKLLVLKDKQKIVAWVNFFFTTYNLCFRNFMVKKEYRSQGVARLLLNQLESLATNHHDKLIRTGKKPTDINLMFLQSLTYFNSEDDNDKDEIFHFGDYLKKQNFKACEYSKSNISNEEKSGIKVYQILFSNEIQKLKIFRKCVVNSNGTLRQDVVLNKEIQSELQNLDYKQWQIVMDGLTWKLNNYTKTKKVCYRYDICPVCKEMKSTEQNSDNCQKCFIHKTCQEPFRKIGRFKEDHEISGVYFQAVQRFLMNIMTL